MSALILVVDDEPHVTELVPPAVPQGVGRLALRHGVRAIGARSPRTVDAAVIQPASNRRA